MVDGAHQTNAPPGAMVLRQNKLLRRNHQRKTATKTTTTAPTVVAADAKLRLRHKCKVARSPISHTTASRSRLNKTVWNGEKAAKVSTHFATIKTKQNRMSTPPVFTQLRRLVAATQIMNSEVLPLLILTPQS